MHIFIKIELYTIKNLTFCLNDNKIILSKIFFLKIDYEWVYVCKFIGYKSSEVYVLHTCLPTLNAKLFYFQFLIIFNFLINKCSIKTTTRPWSNCF